MASYYSDLFAARTTPGTLDVQKRASAGLSHGRLRYAIAHFDPGAVVASSSTVRMKQFKSGDRINSILLTSNDSGSAGDIDVGLYKTGTNHDGAVIDADLFASAQDVNAASRVSLEIFAEASLGVLDLGKTLWELAGQSSDPMEDWDLVVSFPEATTDAAFHMLLEIYYTSGD